jgi:chromosome segregation ATPase
MEKTIDERVQSLETIYTDIPYIMNLRFERINAQWDEVSGRLGLLDKQVGMLMRDMRDIRGGVTRILVEQEKRLNGIDARLDGIERRLDGLERRLGEVETRQGSLEQRMGTLEQKLGALEVLHTATNTKLDLILARLPGG